jgi:hypothetical protein
MKKVEDLYVVLGKYTSVQQLFLKYWLTKSKRLAQMLSKNQ